MKALSEWDSKLRLGQRLPRPAEILAISRAQAEEFAASMEGRIVANPPTISPDTISLVKPTYNLHWDVSNVLGAKNASLDTRRLDDSDGQFADRRPIEA